MEISSIIYLVFYTEVADVIYLNGIAYDTPI